MKQQKTRELLVTTKAARNWNNDFDQRVDELMSIVSRVDNDVEVQTASEILNVYHSAPQKAGKARRRKLSQNDRPFEFLVFRN